MIEESALQEMYDLVDLEKEVLYTALREMGSKVIKHEFREDWSEERPLVGTCYFVHEAILKCKAPEGTKSYVCPYKVKFKHWFLVYPNGKRIDLISEYCDEDIDYSRARPQNFMWTKAGISKRARTLADLLGWEVKSK